MTSAAAAVATALTLGATGAAHATEPDGAPQKKCGDYSNLKAAQIALDVDKLVALDTEFLSVANGIAFDKPKKVEDQHDSDDDHQKSFRDKDCDDSDSQADAQTVLDEDRDDPHDLDADDDRVACESLSDEDAGHDDKQSEDDKQSKDDKDDNGGGPVTAKPKGGVDTGGSGA